MILKIIFFRKNACGQARTQGGGGTWPPKNFKTLRSNFDICRNFQSLKMKFIF